jgi:flagellar protein FliS
MSYAAAVSRYQQNDVASMSPARQVVFLYSHALASLRMASRHIAQKDVEARERAMNKARDIFSELLGTLDFEAGGQIAHNLAGLYAWFIDETMHIDATRDGARLTRLIGMVAELHGAWDQAAQQVSEAPTAAAV